MMQGSDDAGIKKKSGLGIKAQMHSQIGGLERRGRPGGGDQ
jgi:hypothetical protein